MLKTRRRLQNLPTVEESFVSEFKRVAVIIPCYNEAVTIADVVRDMKTALPGSRVYVYDNNSVDQTSARAAEAGAIVRAERLQGKGNVVRRMFGDVDADVYVLVDGDGTYDPMSAPKMVEKLVRENLDMVVGCRQATGDAAYRAGHVFGNRMLTRAVGLIFGKHFTDILSGYRVFSRRFVKSFPALTRGFEIETELTVHAITLAVAHGEVDTPYGARPEGSASKLNTYRDGVRILTVVMALFRKEKPFLFFSAVAGLLAATSIVLVVPVVMTYLETGLVPRFPTAILSASLMVIAALSFLAGIILDTVTHGRREMKRLAYLAQESREQREAAW